MDTNSRTTFPSPPHSSFHPPILLPDMKDMRANETCDKAVDVFLFVWHASLPCYSSFLPFCLFCWLFVCKTCLRQTNTFPITQKKKKKKRMGCSDSKQGAPDNRYAPVRQQQPYHQQPYQQQPQTYQRPGTIQAPPPQPTYQPAPQPVAPYQASYSHPPATAPQPVPQLNTTMASGRLSNAQREILEQQEVQATAAVLSARGPRSNSYGQPTAVVSPVQHQSPPVQQTNQQLARKNTETMMSEQRNAGVDQLASVYPNIDREVISALMVQYSGNEERLHTTLLEMQTQNAAASAAAGASTPSPIKRQGSFHNNNNGEPSLSRHNSSPFMNIQLSPGEAIDAMYQGEWFPCVIRAVQENGDYLVQWDADQSQTVVVKADIRPRQQQLTSM
eukprot:TRINITY_DN3710_c3_g1_i1.p1 TRINITY_DN3710_c3_g1~~TRINITY_DN3710_c3_g1_i1.p1  ORF type:complete len:389 (+),score=56.39 TRINITY_DN3710_c3_g1_i1:665-1831(+)